MMRALFGGFRNRSVLLQVAGNSAWLLADKVLRVTVGLVVAAVVARYLGPGPYGALSAVFAYILLLGALAALGLEGILVRELIRDEPGRPVLLGTAFALRCGGAATAFLLGNALAPLLGIELEGLWLLVAVASVAFLFSPADVLEHRFQSMMNARAIVAARSSAFMVASAAKLLLVAIGAPLVLFAATPSLESAVAAALLAGLYALKEGGFRGWRFDRGYAASLLKAAAPVAVSGLLVAGTMQIDRIMIASIAGHHAAGIYSAAALLSTVWHMVPVVVGASVAAVLTRLYEVNRADYETRLQDVFSALSFGSLCVAIGMTALSEPLILLIFGDAYAPAALILAIHVWAGIFVAHVSIRSRALLIEGRTASIAAFSALTLAANVGLNLLLIPRHGAVGAAWAFLVAWALCALLFPLCSSASRAHTRMLVRSLFPGYWSRALTG
jgi:polysaccharide transporter, PST family